MVLKVDSHSVLQIPTMWLNLIPHLPFSSGAPSSYLWFLLLFLQGFKLLEGQHGANLWIYVASRDDEGIYTCICTWAYNHKVYMSSASRRLLIKGGSVLKI